MTMHGVAGGLIVAVGTSLIAVAGLGLLRLPDSYNRINAVTKGATLGVCCVLLGVMIIAPSPTSVTVLPLATLLQLLTAPFASYTLGRAAHRSGSPLATITHHNDLHSEATPNQPTPPP